MALGGFLLLLPPTGRPHAQLNDWKRMGVYDTRESCENEITLQRSGAQHMFPNPGEQSKSTDQEDASAFDAAECVPDDDVRLK